MPVWFVSGGASGGLINSSGSILALCKPNIKGGGPLSDRRRAEGMANGILVSIKNLVKNMGVSVEQAMSVLEIPEAERQTYDRGPEGRDTVALDIEEQYEKIYRYCFYRLHSRHVQSEQGRYGKGAC